MFLEQKYISDEIKEFIKNEDLTPLFLYAGIYNYKTVNAQLVTLKEYLQSHISSKQTIRRIYSILMECIENINRHGFLFEKNKAKSIYAYVIFAANATHFSVIVGNFISNTEILVIKNAFDKAVIIIDEDKLQDEFSYRILNEELSEKQGIGVGIIDIALMSKEPIKYKISPFNKQVSFLTLEITIKNNI